MELQSKEGREGTLKLAISADTKKLKAQLNAVVFCAQQLKEMLDEIDEVYQEEEDK